jgi:hypothetical protein
MFVQNAALLFYRAGDGEAGSVTGDISTPEIRSILDSGTLSFQKIIIF